MTHTPDSTPHPQPSPEYVRAHELFFRSAAQAMAAIVTLPERAVPLGWHWAVGLTLHIPGLEIAYNNLHYSEGDERYVLAQQERRDYEVAELIGYHMTRTSGTTELVKGIKTTDKGIIEVTSGEMPITSTGAEVTLPWGAVPADDVEQINTLTASSLYQTIIDLDRAFQP